MDQSVAKRFVIDAIARFGPADWPAIAIGAVAALTDLRTRRIPNLLTFGGAAAGAAWGAWTGGLAGAGWSAAGWAVGLLLLLPLYLLRSLGAGDVKLLAAFGAWLGPANVIWAGLYGTIAGGVLALVVAIASGYLGKAMTNLYTLLMTWRVTGVRPVDHLTLESSQGPRLPRAVPMFVGLVVTLWLKQ